MSYDYFLVRLASKDIKSLREFDSINCVENSSTSIEDVVRVLSKIYGIDRWDKWEWQEVKHNDGVEKTCFSQILDMPGRFEVTISGYKFLHLDISGSYHVKQVEEIMKIARHLKMSAFDVQTGERIYYQET
jgi:hypothetical protein